MVTVWCVARRRSVGHGTLPSHQPREPLAHLSGAPMPPRVLCPGGDHRPPATGGSCACGMVTRVPTRKPPVRPGPLVPPEVRDMLARCLYDGPGDPLAPDVNNHRLADMQISRLLRLRADRVLALLSDAGLVVRTDEEIPRVA